MVLSFRKSSVLAQISWTPSLSYQVLTSLLARDGRGSVSSMIPYLLLDSNVNNQYSKLGTKYAFPYLRPWICPGRYHAYCAYVGCDAYSVSIYLIQFFYCNTTR